MKTFRLHKGISLIEILVVITTSTILMGILLPSLSSVRKQAKKTVCLSNLRQMATAASTYTIDNDGHFPLAYKTEKVNGVRRFVSWDFTTWKDWSAEEPVDHVETGLLWMGETIGKVQQCPSFRGSANWLSDPHTGYNYNTSYIGINENIQPATSTRVIEVKSPSQTVLFGDGEYTGGANKFMRSPFASNRDLSFANSDRYAGAQGFRHMHSTNISFCDGHAGSQKKYFTTTDPAGQEILEEYNETHDIKIGFLSLDNKLYDLR